MTPYKLLTEGKTEQISNALLNVRLLYSNIDTIVAGCRHSFTTKY